MHEPPQRPSGLPGVPALSWGTHACCLFHGAAAQLELLVPFFQAGLEAGERCVWGVSGPLSPVGARQALAAVLPLGRFEARGAIEIVDATAWYGEGLAVGVGLDRLYAYEARAISDGYAGLRISGTIAAAARPDWAVLRAYEERLAEELSTHRIVGVCAYCADELDAVALADTALTHELSLLHRGDVWQARRNPAVELLRDELRELHDLVSVAAHELRNPLAALLLQLDGLARKLRAQGLGPDAVSARVDKALGQARRIEALAVRLLDASRAVAEVPVAPAAPVDLALVVADAVERAEDDAVRAGCPLLVQAEEPVVGAWDRLRLEQIVSNLVSNALKYAPGAPVEIEVAGAAELAVLRVRDHGPGIPPADHERIFERFARGEMARDRAGFGLGLWIVRQLAEAMGGAVRVESTPGHGATFEVTLPRRGRAPIA